MTDHRLQIRFLSFHGPHRVPAVVRFGPGLNVIYGASNTGKSFIVDAIDFMLGGKGPLRDIPERVGYDRVLLAVSTLAREDFTLSRAIDGGPFMLFEGLHSSAFPSGEGLQLADQHNEKREDNLSSYLLSKLLLSQRRIKRNKRGDTQSLSFRNLARLVVVNEEEIIQQRSPLSDGNYTADTANTAVFKFMLTGVDDSALVSASSRSPEEQSREAQLDLLDELIVEQHKKIRELAGPPKQLEEQLDKLDDTMHKHGVQLATTEVQYREASARRRELLRRIEDGQNRLTEIEALLDRFEHLSAHYTSDVERLAAIQQAGNLFVALGEARCPLCGAEPEHHQSEAGCDGDVASVVEAAGAEIGKIEQRRAELKVTIATLSKEQKNLERRLPGVNFELQGASADIDEILGPNLRYLRTTYAELADKRGGVKEALGIYKTLEDLQDRKVKLEASEDGQGVSPNYVDVDMSTSIVDKFSNVILKILKSWQFPEVDRVYFDLKIRDLVINGKNRVSFGKGLRAITQAAFTVGLLEYCQKEETPHPGFAILDSPLLSYREPENLADDLSTSDLDSHFYNYLLEMSDKHQVIVVENTDPPVDVQNSSHAVKFTGQPGVGRSGLFPTVA